MHLHKTIVILSLIFSIGFAGTICATDVSKAEAMKVVNINTAESKILQTLKGIGVKKAQEIIEYRNKNGGFKKIDDLKLIKGFTDKFLIKLQHDNPGLIEITSKTVV
jgi:comEA protein